MKHTLFRESSMTEGPVLQGMLAFFLPIMLGTLLQQLYSAVDAVVLGQFVGKTALAAVGGSDIVLINLIVNFFVGLSSGASVVISQHAGAQEHVQVSRAVHTAVFLAIIVGALTMLLGTFGAPLLLPALSTPEDTLQYSKDYLVWYFAGMIPSMIYNMGSGILRALGDSRATLYFLLVSSVLNVVLDLLFVAGFHMGVAGAAIATVLSQLASCVVGFSYMRRRYELLRFSAHELRLDRTAAARVLQIGAPMALQQSIVSCGFLFLQKLVNLFGESMIASYTVATRMENILMIPILGVQNTMATFAGQNMGAQRPDRVSRGLGQGVLVSLSMTLVLCLCQIFGISRIIRAFQLDEAAAAICRLHLFSSAVAMPIFAVYFPANGMCQGVGEGFHATFFALLALGLRVIFAYALHNTALFGYTAVWWSQAMAWTVTLLVCYAHVFRGKWKNKSLI